MGRIDSMINECVCKGRPGDRHPPALINNKKERKKEKSRLEVLARRNGGKAKIGTLSG